MPATSKKVRIFRRKAEADGISMPEVIWETQAQVSDLRQQFNHARIQLHLYQLKLEMLKERENELKAEIDAVRGQLSSSVNQTTEKE